MNDAIVVENLKKTYSNGVEAVRGISFSVHYGEIFGSLGPNGAGKSTTIKTVIGLLKPTEGKIMLDGVDITKDPYKARLAKGYASQETAVDDRLTAYENIYLQGKYFHMSDVEIKKNAEKLLKMFGLWERRNDLVESFSGGMMKRLDIAAALIHQPKILFLDEPTLGLDIQTRSAIWEYIRNFKKNGMTIFLTTHYLEEADALSDRVAIIDHGKIMALDKPGVLKSQIGGDLITITFAKGDTEKFLEKIKTLPNIKDVSPMKNGVYSIVVEKNGDQMIPELFKIANTMDVGIASVRLKRPTLDDVYMKYTGRTIREAESSSGESKKMRMMQRRMRR
jgi:ABC-2 type transport system ATP-binding protein